MPPGVKRFPDMSRVFDAKLGETAQECALKLGIAREKEFTLECTGPEMETPAETTNVQAVGS